MTRVEPEWAMVTILFADIRGFTSFADRATAREAVAYLNDFFETAVPVVYEHEGEVNQLLGDGMLAVFASPAHADCALRAAVHLLTVTRPKIGVGINSGLVLTGTMGAGDALHHGVVGDPVNVAARVQDATRDLGEPLLLTDATRLLLEADHPRLASRGTISLRGKAEPIAVHGLAEDFVTLSGRFARRKEPGWQL